MLYRSIQRLLCVAGIALVTSGADLSSEIDTVLQARFDSGDFSGTALVARGDRIVYERGFGLANREWRIPNDARTKFELGSITKQFTALLVLQFVNEGKIKISGHISDYLPYYRRDNGVKVTVHQLLSHTSGIRSEEH